MLSNKSLVARIYFLNPNLFLKSEAIYFYKFQLQKDAEELRKFLDAAERQKVKDIISIELRKIETEIYNKIAKDKEQTEPVKSTSTPKTVTPHTPTTELRNYGKKVFLTLIHCSRM